MKLRQKIRSEHVLWVVWVVLILVLLLFLVPVTCALDTQSTSTGDLFKAFSGASCASSSSPTAVGSSSQQGTQPARLLERMLENGLSVMNLENVDLDKLYKIIKEDYPDLTREEFLQQIESLRKTKPELFTDKINRLLEEFKSQTYSNKKSAITEEEFKQQLEKRRQEWEQKYGKSFTTSDKFWDISTFDPHALPFADKLFLTQQWATSPIISSMMDFWPSGDEWEARMCEVLYSTDTDERSWNDASIMVGGLSVNSIYIAAEKSLPLPDNTTLYQIYFMVRTVEGTTSQIDFSLYVVTEDGRKLTVEYNGEPLRDVEVESGDIKKGYKVKYSDLKLKKLCIDYEKTRVKYEDTLSEETECVPFVQEDYKPEYSEGSVPQPSVSRGAQESARTTQLSDLF